ncbi:MAG TPA: hypothetical protein VEI47_04310, partial [Gemmatimonadales bacterium]|nr:hypothetical protein [Gemmatimonadales bacterium]
SQRERWTRGRRAALRRYAGPLLRSERIGWLQKLDAILELSLPGPVVVASIAFVLAGLGLVLGGTGGLLIAGIAVGSQLPLIVATTLVTLRHPHPGRVILALVRLPVYAVWRVGVAIGTWVGVANTSWTRTQRNETGDPQSQVPAVAARSDRNT